MRELLLALGALGLVACADIPGITPVPPPLPEPPAPPVEADPPIERGAWNGHATRRSWQVSRTGIERNGSFSASSLCPASLSALTEAAAAINSTLELDSVLQTIARLACSVARAEASCVFLLDHRNGKLVVAAATA